MSKRIAIVFLCLVIAMTLGACSKPFGGTPYESLGSWETDSNDIPDGTESDEILSNDSSTIDTGISSTTEGSGQSTTRNDTTSASAKKPTVSGGTTSDSDTQKTTGGTSSVGTPAGTTTTTKPKPATTKPTTTNTTAAEVRGVQLPAEGYSQDGKLVVSKVSLQDNKVTIEFKNTYSRYETDGESAIDYVCYDKDGKELSAGTISIGALKSGETVTRSFELEKDTDRVELRNWNVPFWTEGWY